MAQAYTPGLKVTPCVRWRARRVLPIAGAVRVDVGQRVDAQDVIAEAQLPGDATPINLAKLLGVAGSDLPRCLFKNIGDAVDAGERLAQSPGLFGFFPTLVHAPVAGTLESVSRVTGQVILRGAPQRVEVRAYLTGTVVEVLPREGAVIEADAAVIQGIFGVGGDAYGVVRPVCRSPQQDLTDDLLTEALRGQIVVGGRRVTSAALRQARALGVAAVVSGGIDDHDLHELLGYDLGVAVTGDEKIGLTVIVTEGFGDIAMAQRTFDLLQRHAGARAAVNGATQIRAGVLRPEIVIPLVGEHPPASAAATEGVLARGAPVRVIREPHFGELGVVAELPPEPQTLASESKARVVQVTLAGGGTVVVPRANVELIEG